MSKRTRTLALFPILALVLTACTLGDIPVIGKYFGGGSGANGGASAPKTTLTVWGLWEDPQVVQALINKYTQEHPNVAISYEDRSIMQLDDYKERIFGRFQQETSDIDVALIHNSWVSRISPVLEPAPDNLFTADSFEESFYPAAVASSVVGGEVVAVPAYHDGLVLVYNKEHFNEISQSSPPTAWEEFRRLALELTVRGEEGALVRSGAAIGAANNIDHFADIIGLMWSQADVGVTPDLSGKTNYEANAVFDGMLEELDSRPAQDALTFYTNFFVEDKVWSVEFPEATQAFVAGRTSMIFVPSWQVVDIISAIENPSVVGVASVPQAIPEDPRAWATFWEYSVSKNSPRKDLAWDFLAFLMREESQLMYYDEATKVRPFGSLYSLKSLENEVGDEYLRPVLEMAPYAKTLPIAARAGNGTAVDALKTAVNSVISGETSEDALTIMKEELSQ